MWVYMCSLGVHAGICTSNERLSNGRRVGCVRGGARTHVCREGANGLRRGTLVRERLIMSRATDMRV